MTEYGLQPSYVKFDYSTAFGSHSQTIPTVQWLPVSITGGMGSYVAWDTVAIDAEAMIDALIVVMKPFLSSDANYDLVTIYDFDTGSEKFRPVAQKAVAVAGTGTTNKPRKATQQTFNMRSTGGSPAKVVFLDVPIGANDFDKTKPLDFNAAQIALVDELALTSNGWAARDNTRINAAVSNTFDLNDALRKQYHMI